MKNIRVEWHESGLIVSQKGVSECVVVLDCLKYNFYEEMLIACLDGNYASWSDLDGNRLLLNYECKNKFNVFINNCYCGDLPFIPLSETSIAIPVETGDTEKIYEIYDSEIVECYLLYESELLLEEM